MGRKTDIDPDRFAQVNVRMTKEFKEECDTVAEQEGVSLNEWIRRAMKDRLCISTGKDITSEIAELPPAYRKIINKMISENIDDINSNIDILQKQIYDLRDVIADLSPT